MSSFRPLITGLLGLSLLAACGVQPVAVPHSSDVVQQAAVATLRTTQLSACNGLLKLRVGIQRPAGEVKGDVLYVHGYADRLDNHGPLFKAWTDAGLRVISFDLPSHGENAGLKNKLDLFSFEELAGLALDVERHTREEARRPLVLAGWSTGGLLAVRMAQTDAFNGSGRKLAGLALFTPGVSVHTLVGEKGIVTQRTLTNNPNPPHRGAISPKSPLLTPVFATQLLANAALSQRQSLPKHLPTLVLVAGDREDVYAKSPEIRSWSQKQRQKGALVWGLAYAGAKHELDNEPAPVGNHVRQVAADFVAQVAAGIPVAVDGMGVATTF